jgi:hypothetical protein
LQLTKRVPVPKPGDPKGRLFLVISENVGVRQVVDASYEHLISTPANEIKADSHRVLLSYDREQHRYFIPLDEIVDEKGEGLSSLDLQILDLSFQFNDGSISHAEIRFYVKVDLPPAEQLRISQVPGQLKFNSSELKASTQKLAKEEGWTVLTERYTNPISQPLFLWFSVNDVSYQIETELGLKVDWSGYSASSPPTDAGFEPDLHQYSRARLEKLELRFRDVSEAKTRSISIAQGFKRAFRLNPGQTLEFEWKVFATNDVPLCLDGALGSRTVWFCDTQVRDEWISREPWSPKCKRMEDPQIPPVFKNPLQMKGTWTVRGYQILGGFTSQVTISEEGGALSQAMASGLTLPLNPPENVKPELQTSSYSCQGIF